MARTSMDNNSGGFHGNAGDAHNFEHAVHNRQLRTLYVGNLDPSVPEELIHTLFSQVGHVIKTTLFSTPTNDPYAFVEFADHASAVEALQTMNHRKLIGREMKVNWPSQLKPQQQQKVDTSKHYHVFVGDLSPEVDNAALQMAFAPFGSISDVKVIRDATTQKSKGYGFVSYPNQADAERAIERMNGQWVGKRTIRTNWATRKPTEGGSGGGKTNAQGSFPTSYPAMPAQTAVPTAIPPGAYDPIAAAQFYQYYQYYYQQQQQQQRNQ